MRSGERGAAGRWRGRAGSAEADPSGGALGESAEGAEHRGGQEHRRHDAAALEQESPPVAPPDAASGRGPSLEKDEQNTVGQAPASAGSSTAQTDGRTGEMTTARTSRTAHATPAAAANLRVQRRRRPRPAASSAPTTRKATTTPRLRSRRALCPSQSMKNVATSPGASRMRRSAAESGGKDRPGASSRARAIAPREPAAASAPRERMLLAHLHPSHHPGLLVVDVLAVEHPHAKLRGDPVAHELAHGDGQRRVLERAPFKRKTCPWRFVGCGVIVRLGTMKRTWSPRLNRSRGSSSEPRAR